MSSRHRFRVTTAGLRQRLASIAWPLNCGLALVAFAVVVSGQGPQPPSARPWVLDSGAAFRLEFQDRGGAAAEIIRHGWALRP
jgi:hypothetical protein